VNIKPAKENSKNITISVTRIVGYTKYFGDFEGIFQAEKGNILYEERITRGNFWSWLGSCKSSEIDIEIPLEYLSGAKLRISQDIGKVLISKIHSAKLERLYIHSKMGEFMLAGISAVVLEAESHSGGLKLSDLSGTKMIFSTNSGDIEIVRGAIALEPSSDHTRPSLDISTNYGKINLGTLRWVEDSDVKVKNMVGDIGLRSMNFDGKFHAVTKQGHIAVTGDAQYEKNTPKEKIGSFGNGTSTLSATSWKGDIHLLF
jgi:DUF4097 and DUF4098 domain-containing protein YvlB